MKPNSLIILILIILLIISIISNFQRDKTYPLEGNKILNKSDILQFQDSLVLNYNKNLEWNAPDNNKLYNIFTLNRSIRSVYLLSYDGAIGFAIYEDKHPAIKIEDFKQPERIYELFKYCLHMVRFESDFIINHNIYFLNPKQYAYLQGSLFLLEPALNIITIYIIRLVTDMAITDISILI